jgi:hypothetical protein
MRQSALPLPVLPVGGRMDEQTGAEIPVQLKISLVVVNRVGIHVDVGEEGA